MRDVKFPRSVNPAGTIGQLELVGFCDGGDPASVGCVYRRYEMPEDLLIKAVSGKGEGYSLI